MEGMQANPAQIKKYLKQLNNSREQYINYLGQLAYQEYLEGSLPNPKLQEACSTLDEVAEPGHQVGAGPGRHRTDEASSPRTPVALIAASLSPKVRPTAPVAASRRRRWQPCPCQARPRRPGSGRGDGEALCFLWRFPRVGRHLLHFLRQAGSRRRRPTAAGCAHAGRPRTRTSPGAGSRGTGRGSASPRPCPRSGGSCGIRAIDLLKLRQVLR